MSEKKNVSRRAFLTGGAVAAATSVAAGAMAGCASPQVAGSGSGTQGGGGGSVTDMLDADLPDAAPIMPKEAPSSWDAEADVVVVGMGGGGIAASLYCAEKGLNVIAVEKESGTGGATQHACGWFTLPGGSKMQNEMQYAYPEFPFDPKKFVRAIQPQYQYTFDDELMYQLAVKGGECEDWMLEHDLPMICMGPLYMDARIEGGIQPLGMRYIVQDMTKKAEEAGVDIRLNTECESLVMENGRVTGITVRASDGEQYIRAEKGVILCTGSFGANKDMLAKYCPSALRNAAVGGPFPFADGAGQRMAIGAGADMCGLDSWCCGEAYPYRGDGAFWTFHWDGSVILCRQAWLTIDKLGNRYGYYSTDMDEFPESYGGAGDYINAATQMSRMGGGGYCIFDADYEKHMEILAPEVPFSDDRHPLTPERLKAANIQDTNVIESLCHLDWREDVAEALERGDIKKADTIEGLADQLGLDPEILAESIDKWNETCKKGSDDDSIWPYKKEWLIPIQKAPYYGARVSGGIGKTFAGPRVTPKMEVIDKECHVIPGLYAHFMTAGGVCGENYWNGTMYNTTIHGGNAMSWISGYMAAQSVCEA